MKRLNLNITISISYLFITLLCTSGTTVSARQSQPDYNIAWNSQSRNSGESMPCGGGDIGLNVWVEDNDVLFYISKSGTFDENNTLLKQGRIRIRLTPNPFNGGIFKQELKLQEGYIEIEGKNENISSKIRIWVDVFNPVINVDINNNRDLKTEVYYESWRYQDRLLRKRESNQNSYKWAAPEELKTLKDEISFTGNDIIFYHRNQPNSIFDAVVRQQGMESVKDRMFNPLYNLTFGGKIETTGLKPAGNETGTYADTDFKAWKLESEKAQRSCQLRIYLHTSPADHIESWKEELNKTITNYKKKEKDHIAILDRTNEIQGLLLDLIV
jgi:cupin superfamily acireductone dioxygenase involved in methionine salvage